MMSVTALHCEDQSIPPPSIIHVGAL